MPRHNNKFSKPSNERYKKENHLKKNKIRRLMSNNGFETEKEAEKFWDSVRKRGKK